VLANQADNPLDSRQQHAGMTNAAELPRLHLAGNDAMLYEEELTEKIIGAAIEVHRALGPVSNSLAARSACSSISMSPCSRMGSFVRSYRLRSVTPWFASHG
jgi:hypothetical protein